MKARHRSPFAHMRMPHSSMMKTTAPAGALKAAATPAAAPTAQNSRFWASRRKVVEGTGRVKPNRELLPWDTMAPTHAPMWAMGPSNPKGSPELMARGRDSVFATRVLNRSSRGMFTPFMYAFNSGMPLPVARGSMYVTSRAAAREKPQEMPTYTPAPPHTRVLLSLVSSDINQFTAMNFTEVSCLVMKMIRVASNATSTPTTITSTHRFPARNRQSHSPRGRKLARFTAEANKL